jgi:hypothetical protein
MILAILKYNPTGVTFNEYDVPGIALVVGSTARLIFVVRVLHFPQQGIF